MIYWFKHKYEQIQRLIEYIPILWNTYDFDYIYAIRLFQIQLNRIAKYLESGKATTEDAHVRAQKIRTAIELMNRVYEDRYAYEWVEKLENKYGKDVFEFETKVGEDGKNYLQSAYESWDVKVEITEDIKNELPKSIEKQNKAHRILWKFVEHNIQRWWD